MKKVIAIFIILSFMICLVSCKQANEVEVKQYDNQFGITHIELAYFGHLEDTVIIEDEETITKLAAYIENADGLKSTSTKGVYGIPYILKLHYKDGNAVVFYLWDDGRYSTSEDTDKEGYSYFYLDDMRDMFQYLRQKFPV